MYFHSNDDLQTQRLMKRSNLTEEEARKRIESQMPLELKCQKSHFVIENSGDYSATESATLNILSVLNASKHHWRVRAYLLLGCSILIASLVYLGKVFNLF